MHTYSNGFIASNFTEESPNFKGTQIRAERKKTRNTLERERAEKSIIALAKQRGVSVDEYVTKIVLNNNGVIRDFVISKGVIPAIDPLHLGVQAALLRADDIAAVASALDVDDDEALDHVEAAEYEAKDINSPDALMLPTDVQGALSIMLNHARGKIGIVGRGRLNQVLRKVNEHKADGFTATPGSTLGGGLFVPQTIPGTTSTPTAPIVTGLDKTINSIMGVFDKVLAGVTSVTGKVQETSTGILGGVKSTASDIGSDAITKSLKENAPYIIGGIILLALLIFIAVYAAKSK